MAWTRHGAYLLSVSGLPRALHSSLVLLEVNKGSRQPRPVGNAGEQQLGSLVQLVLETLLSNDKYIRNVRDAQEVFHVVEAVGLGVRVGQFGVDLWLAEALAGHLEVANQVFVFVCSSRNLNDLVEVRRILGLDVGIYNGLSEPVELYATALNAYRWNL